MNKEYKCSDCEKTYPTEKLLFGCEIDKCKDDKCAHSIECGVCTLLIMPPGASVNMDVILGIL